MADKKPVLLVVEDDQGLQAQLKWAYDDFEVVPALDRESALAALRAHEPAVVTLDLVITSYSIHYTKLYDSAAQRSSSRTGKGSAAWCCRNAS